MNRKRRTWSLIALTVIVIAIIVAIIIPRNQQHHNSAAGKGTTIVIGSKDFSESKTVMQIWADALRQKGYKVETKPNIASSVVYKAIQSKQIDLYPEYTGTIAMAYLGKHIVGKTPQQIADIAQKGVAKKGLTALAYAPGSDSQGIAIRTSLLRSTISIISANCKRKLIKFATLRKGNSISAKTASRA